MTDNPVLTGFLVGQVAADAVLGPMEQMSARAHGVALANESYRNQREVMEILEDQVVELTTRLNETYRALVAEQAHAKGQAAMLSAYRAQHPDSPLRRDSGKRFKDGDIKTAATLIFEQAHDAHIAQYGARVGITDPTEVRAD
jgi:hypothetical protein